MQKSSQSKICHTIPLLLRVIISSCYNSCMNVVMICIFYYFVPNLRARHKEHVVLRHEIRIFVFCFKRTNHWPFRYKSVVLPNKCSQQHHLLLHTILSIVYSREDNTLSRIQTDAIISSWLVSQHTDQNDSYRVILGTTLIHMHGSTGVFHKICVLIDSASK